MIQHCKKEDKKKEKKPQGDLKYFLASIIRIKIF
jgi:hypothetical protein